MNKLNELKSVIHKAVPSILELKFGCEVEVLCDDSDFYGKVKPCWVSAPITEVSPNEVVITVLWPYPNKRIEIQERIDKGELKILGRPISLSDVLQAQVKNYWTKKEVVLQICEAWNLLDDNLDHQSEETLEFLTNLLLNP